MFEGNNESMDFSPGAKMIDYSDLSVQAQAKAVWSPVLSTCAIMAMYLCISCHLIEWPRLIAGFCCWRNFAFTPPWLGNVGELQFHACFQALAYSITKNEEKSRRGRYRYAGATSASDCSTGHICYCYRTRKVMALLVDERDWRVKVVCISLILY